MTGSFNIVIDKDTKLQLRVIVVNKRLKDSLRFTISL